jgi:hypothetical protein
MNERLKDRIAEEWAQLDPVDPLRRLLSDVIDVLAQTGQVPVGKWTGKEIEWTENPYKLKQGQFIYTTPQQQEPRNFCPRCGKRLHGMAFAAGGIHTCTPPRGLENT